MRTVVWSVTFITTLLVALRIYGQTTEERWNQELSGADTAAVVRESVERVRSNIGGWCATPEAESLLRLLEIGKPAVPYLTDSLKRNDLPAIDQFVAEVLSAMCCYTFDSKSHDALVTEIEKWWKVNRERTEQQWILDALRSADDKRIAFADGRITRLRDPQHVVDLVSLLESQNQKAAAVALYTLWENFKSEEALRYVRKVCRDGTPERKKMVLGFCGDKKPGSFSPVIAEVLRTETDYGVLATALEAAKKTRAADCLSVIEEMDHGPSSKYPKKYVIEALAELKKDRYADRLLYYLEKGDRDERMAAAEMIDTCVSLEEAVVPLLVALKDPDINVRQYATISLGRVASNKNNQRRLGQIVPALINLFHHEDESDLGWLAHKALWQICESHFPHDPVPKVDDGLGGSGFSKQAFPIWEKWWTLHGANKDLER